MRLKNWLILVGFVALAEGAGAVGSIFTAPAIDTWYATLTKPELAPPNWVFAPVWTTLFLLMGIAAFLVWSSYTRAADGQVRRRAAVALWVFMLQLVLNVFWSVIFFGWHNLGAAFVEIAMLWLAIVATIAAFGRVSRAAAWLLVPYLVWVTFASYLNYQLWVLN